MKSLFFAGASVGVIAAAATANAADRSGSRVCDPYTNYACLDAYLGENPAERFINYYRLEWGRDGAPSDPKAPPGRITGWGPAPQTTPPYPFTEWPYGGATSLGVTRPNSVDSPLMVSIANTALGKAMNDAHIQVYGWVNGGGNISTNKVTPGGNFPAAYSYSPNTVQLDQAVVYVERLPDTVQKDHVDWGFRVSAIYGENYRYTTSFGLASYQLLGHNLNNGYDLPMLYGEVYIPQVMDGLLLRFGRFISVPDIEAQLAPNNYMYSHSMTYTYDNYTNTGLIGTVALNQNWFVQAGLVFGTDTALWNYGKTIQNPFPNAIYPGTTMLKDPGNQPSLIAGLRWQSDSGRDNVYVVANGINDGTWGYNNLQWYGVTWYHKFNDQWHLSVEAYTSSQKKVLNATDPLGIIANGGYPFSAAANPNFQFNAPFFAQCGDTTAPTCDSRVIAALFYLNYRATALDNISLRGEFFNDMNGQRTGVKTRYLNAGLGWQHWFSPQIEIRPEVSYYHSMDGAAFNGNGNALSNAGVGVAIPPTKSDAIIASADLIIHF